MRGGTVARTYAEALFEFATRDDEVDRYARQLQEVADIVETERDFRVFLDAPGIEPADKVDALRKAFGDFLPGHLQSFLFIVIEKRRQRLLPAIAAEFADLVDEHFGRLRVLVTLASEPDSQLESTIKTRLGNIWKRDIIPHFRADERVLGGIVLRIGDVIADGSLRRRLQLMRRQLLKAEVA